MMRIASVLLVAVILTTCAISGTFAKYVTSTSVNDTARLAYWGFGETTQTIELFKTAYNDPTGTTETVKSATTENIVAPGTFNSDTFGFKYTDATNPAITAPEVDYEIEATATVTASATIIETLDNNPNFQWSLIVPGGTVQYYNTVADLQAALVKDKNGNAISKAYKAGELPVGFGDGANQYTIGWKWAFDETDTKADTTQAENKDEYDTAMGNASDLENVSVSFTITATQID